MLAGTCLRRMMDKEGPPMTLRFPVFVMKRLEVLVTDGGKSRAWGHREAEAGFTFRETGFGSISGP